MHRVASQPYEVREALKVPTNYSGDLAAKLEERIRDRSNLCRYLQDFRTLPSSGFDSLPLTPIDLTFCRSLGYMDFSHYPCPPHLGLDPDEFEVLHKWWSWDLPSVVCSFNFPWNEDGALFWRLEGFALLVRLLAHRPWDAEFQRELDIRTKHVRSRR